MAEIVLGWSKRSPLASLGVISLEDTLFGQSSDRDYNDFMVTAAARRSPSASVPEPATLAGIALVGSSLAFSRRRRTAV